MDTASTSDQAPGHRSDASDSAVPGDETGAVGASGAAADAGPGAAAAASGRRAVDRLVGVLRRTARGVRSAGAAPARGPAGGGPGGHGQAGREPGRRGPVGHLPGLGQSGGVPGSFLADAGLLLAESLDPDRVARLLADLVLPHLGAVSLVWLREEDTPQLAASSSLDPRVDQLLRAMISARPPLLADDYPPGLVLRSGQTYSLPRLADMRALRTAATESGYQRFRQLRDGPTAHVPLSAGGEIFGVLSVGRPTGDYRNNEILLLEGLARRGSIALHNAMRFREAQESALTLQRSLLPANPPALDGVEIAMEYRPGTAGTEVGGDFYDIIPLSGGRFGVAIGDVMGRGLQAAAVMGQLRAALRAYALEEWPPADVLYRLDRVVGMLPGLQMATCMYAVYDRHTGRAVIANAGHLAPLVVLPDEDPDYLVLEPGLPLGVGEGEAAGFSETRVTLPPGSALVMFTDGLVESRRRPLSDGLQNLRRGLIEQRAKAAAAREAQAELDAAAAIAAGFSEMADAAPGVWTDRRAPGPSQGPPPGVADRRSGEDRRGEQPLPARGVERRRRRPRGGSFAARSWFGPDVIAGTGEGPAQETARSLLERCLLAADLPSRTDDDTALIVLTTLTVNPPLLELSLPAVAASSGQARTAIRAVLLDYGIAAVEDVTLLVSEVVTNAVLHARSDLVLRAFLEPGRLRVSVEDREGAHLPRPGAAAANRPDPESGWGLLLVEALSMAWGVETTVNGKRVWFDTELPDVGPAPPRPVFGDLSPGGTSDGGPPVQGRGHS
ncbi:ATP-binding SpoIIE family protein phosphatase [Candidatus Frankia nodulisporulans]|uniref:ATP-binding SpoIIE family protein phosphatase n=1 Tax=Candidatus Frankia nodulisporulans TaxID=2060052 RepID=UPI001CDD5D0D|nr:SpoIIE family protein phosphatase [Candidatus Frankia nodulisporulans]